MILTSNIKSTFIRRDFVLIFSSAGELQEVLNQVQRDERLTEHEPASEATEAPCHYIVTPSHSQSYGHSHFVLHLLGHSQDLEKERYLPRVLQDLGVGLGDKLLVPVGGGAPRCGAGGLSGFGSTRKVTD